MCKLRHKNARLISCTSIDTAVITDRRRMDEYPTSQYMLTDRRTPPVLINNQVLLSKWFTAHLCRRIMLGHLTVHNSSLTLMQPHPVRISCVAFYSGLGQTDELCSSLEPPSYNANAYAADATEGRYLLRSLDRQQTALLPIFSMLETEESALCKYLSEAYFPSLTYLIHIRSVSITSDKPTNLTAVSTTRKGCVLS